MKEGRPSVTATFVSFARAAASSHAMTTPALHDELASSLVPSFLRPFVPHGVLGQTIARGATLGLVDHIALRTSAIDAVLADPFPQVVLLGAGLDARAYRLPSLASASVFEVDHPASHAVKVRRVRSERPLCRALVHVAADFEKEDIEIALTKAGFDPRLPSAFVLEGVTMYLPASMTKRLVDVVGRLAAPGSRLAATYLRPPEGVLQGALRRAFQISVTSLGEPLAAAYPTPAFHSLLAEANLDPLSDTCSVEWSALHGASASLALVLRAERLVVAGKRG